MKLEDLDHRQREVVDAVATSDDRIIVLGGAGTGKNHHRLVDSPNLLGDINGDARTTRPVPNFFPLGGEPDHEPLPWSVVRLQRPR